MDPSAPPDQTATIEQMPAPVGSGNQVDQPLGKYLHDTVQRDFMPMSIDCYKDFLSRQPDAGMSMLVDVTIAGDKGVGGVVDSVTVDSGGLPDDDSFVTCLRESMMSMVFDAPPQGQHQVTFTMPIDFSPQPPNGNGAQPH